MRAWRSVGGILGPAAVITAWAALGSRSTGYDPLIDPISRLAASGSTTQPAMTAGFLAYAVGVGAYTSVLGDRYGPQVRAAATLNVIGTVGIAATPLESPLGGLAHAAAAGVTYVSLAAVPLLAARDRRRSSHRPRAVGSVLAGASTAVCLALSTSGLTQHVGLLQRAGLTIGHLWVMASAVAVLRHDSRSTLGAREVTPQLRPSRPSSLPGQPGRGR